MVEVTLHVLSQLTGPTTPLMSLGKHSERELSQFPLGSTRVLLSFADFASFVFPKEILATAGQSHLGEALVPLTHMPPCRSPALGESFPLCNFSLNGGERFGFEVTLPL